MRRICGLIRILAAHPTRQAHPASTVCSSHAAAAQLLHARLSAAGETFCSTLRRSRGSTSPMSVNTTSVPSMGRWRKERSKPRWGQPHKPNEQKTGLARSGHLQSCHRMILRCHPPLTAAMLSAPGTRTCASQRQRHPRQAYPAYASAICCQATASHLRLAAPAPSPPGPCQHPAPALACPGSCAG